MSNADYYVKRLQSLTGEMVEVNAKHVSIKGPLQSDSDTYRVNVHSMDYTRLLGHATVAFKVEDVLRIDTTNVITLH